MPSTYMHTIVYTSSANKFTMTDVLGYTAQRCPPVRNDIGRPQPPKPQPECQLSRPNRVAVAMGYSLACNL